MSGAIWKSIVRWGEPALAAYYRYVRPHSRPAFPWIAFALCWVAIIVFKGVSCRILCCECKRPWWLSKLRGSALCAIITELERTSRRILGLSRSDYFPPIELGFQRKNGFCSPGSPNMSFSQGSHRRQRSAVIFRLPVAMLGLPWSCYYRARLIPDDRTLRPTHAPYVLLCEGIRQEVGGKVTLLGVFAGNRLEIPRDVAFPATLVLGFFAVFLDGEGEYRDGDKNCRPTGR